MSQEPEELIRENIRLTKENNRLLKKLWKAEKWGFWSRVIIFAIIIGLPVLVYQYYLSDVLTDLQGVYREIRGAGEGIRGLPDNISLSTVIESIEEYQRNLVE